MTKDTAHQDRRAENIGESAWGSERRGQGDDCYGRQGVRPPIRAAKAAAPRAKSMACREEKKIKVI